MQAAVERQRCAQCPSDAKIDKYYREETKDWSVPCLECLEPRVFKSQSGVYLALAGSTKTCHTCSSTKVRLNTHKDNVTKEIRGKWQYTCKACSKTTSFAKVHQALDWADQGRCKECSFQGWEGVRRSEDPTKGKWQVECSNCGNFRYYSTRGSACRGSRGSSLCRPCGISKGKKGRKEAYTELQKHLRKARQRAESSGRYNFALELQDIQKIWTGRCRYSGLDITQGAGPHAASLDRIDSSLGYIPSNVAWVHKDINRMKLAYSLEYYLEMCKKVSEYNGDS